MPFFAYPLALLGLTSIPVLVGLYWLRSRFRRHTVSSLVLWDEPQRPRQGGRRLQRFQGSLLFILELLVLLLFVAAAAKPMIRSGRVTRHLVVVLDDSYSLLAENDGSARQRAQEALEAELRDTPRFTARFLRAGPSGQLLAEAATDLRGVRRICQQWTCQAPAGNLTDALQLAHELAADQSHILILTDQPPPTIPEKGTVQWWSFGAPVANLAIVHAARSGTDAGDRCLVQVRNFSALPAASRLVVTTEDGATIREEAFSLAAGQENTFRWVPPAGTAAVRVSLPDGDALSIDNQVVLLPERAEPVPVRVDITGPRLRLAVQQALAAARIAETGPGRYRLLITDEPNAVADEPLAWTVSILAEEPPAAYLGPYLLDESHRLTEGLALEGVIWAAGRRQEVPGRAILLAGDVPLITDQQTDNERHYVRIRLRPELSSLTRSAAWPVLFWNLLEWRRRHLPGLERVNCRLGDKAVFVTENPNDEFVLVDPAGRQERLIPQANSLTAPADRPGIHEIRSSTETARFAVNALQPDESDLRRNGSGRWGNWRDEATLQREYRRIDWVFLLGALGVLAVHAGLIHRHSQMYRFGEAPGPDRKTAGRPG
ncbi:MAG: BatA and WFA domain-containing protein [Sedimentisphaerales bacterium]|nr:BatA and WFA domain-containing protein [Sedimentisphaerales bacterium]